MEKTKYKTLQPILDYYNQKIPTKGIVPFIAVRSAVSLFEEWLSSVGLPFRLINKAYTIEYHTTITPDFLVNQQYYVSVISMYDKAHEAKYLKFRELYGPIVLIPKDKLPDFILTADATDFYNLFHTE